MDKKQWAGVLLAFFAALALYIGFEDWKKGAAIFVASILLDYAIDMIFTKVEQEKGDIPKGGG